MTVQRQSTKDTNALLHCCPSDVLCFVYDLVRADLAVATDAKDSLPRIIQGRQVKEGSVSLKVVGTIGQGQSRQMLPLTREFRGLGVTIRDQWRNTET